ncbi:MAG: OmpA/MotB family protein [Marmoricola sp.]
MSSRRPRREEHEEHVNHERWLVTYADMITLLMVLFIVMFAMSQVDQKKFNELKEGLAAGFGGDSPAVLQNSSSILPDSGDATLQSIVPSVQQAAMTPQQQQQVTQAVAKQDQQQQQRRYAEAQSEADRLAKVLERLQAALRRHHLENDVRAGINDRGLVVSLVSRHVVFDYDMATLTPRGRQVVDTLAPVLRDLPDPLEIDGHTNQEKVKPKYYPTDWELSAARAATVLRRLNEADHVPDRRLTLAAFGHERPLVPPSRPDAAALNKRVDIVVLTRLPEETRSLLDDVKPAGGTS